MTGLERRTPLQRGAPMPRQVTPLARTPMAARVTPMRRAPLATVTPIDRPAAPVRQLRQRGRRGGATENRRQDPGFPPGVHDLIFGRDPRCVLAGWADGPADCWGGDQAHHRELIGMGGTSDPRKHVPEGGLRACCAHHDWAHLNRTTARWLGLICDKGNRLDHPMSFDGGWTWWQFTPEGTSYVPCGPPDRSDAA